MSLKKHRVKTVSYNLTQTAKKIEVAPAAVKYWERLLKKVGEDFKKGTLYSRHDLLILIKIKRLKQKGDRVGYIVENQLYLK